MPAPELTVAPAQFWMADLSANVSGVDVLYLAEQHSLDRLGALDLAKWKLAFGGLCDSVCCSLLAPPSPASTTHS